MSQLNAKLEGLGERRGGDLPPLSSVVVPRIRTFSMNKIALIGLFLMIGTGVGYALFSFSSAPVSDVETATFPSPPSEKSSVPESVNRIFADFSSQAAHQVKSTAKAWQTAVKENDEKLLSTSSSLPTPSVSSRELDRPIESPKKTAENKSAVQPLVSTAAQKNHLVIEKQNVTSHELAEKAIKNGRSFWKKGDTINAITAFEVALRYAPENVSVRQQLASIYFGQGDVFQAEKILLAGLTPDVFQSELRWTLAKLWGQENNPAKALSFLLPNDASTSANYLMLRAQLAQRLAKYPLALSSYEQLTQRFPQLDAAWLGLAIESERIGGLSKAKWAYQRAMTGQSLSSQSMAFIQQRLRLLEDV